MTRIARVFPRRTKATPTDDLAFTGPPGLFLPEIDQVHISVAFSQDLPRAEWLAKQWRHIAPTKIGGPACGEPGADFVPGRYLAAGYVITSRGCPNQCWFCDVWKREGRTVRELPITDGWNVLDDNLLACSHDHVLAVFEMLKRHRGKIQFTGGLEAARLQPRHVAGLWDLRPRQMFFAYDGPEDLEPLRLAGSMLLSHGWTRRAKRLRCYVLVGYPGDTFENAARRFTETISAGFLPMAMLWRSPHDAEPPTEWRRFQRKYARPAAMPLSGQA